MGLTRTETLLKGGGGRLNRGRKKAALSASPSLTSILEAQARCCVESRGASLYGERGGDVGDRGDAV